MAKEVKDRKLCAPKRTEFQKEADRAFIASLMVKCFPVREIAKRLNEKNEKEDRGYTLSAMQVYHDTRIIFDEWKDQKEQFIDAKVELELAKLDKIENECWEAWESSKRGEKKTTIEGGELTEGKVSGGKIKEREHKTTSGEPKYLEIIQGCMEKRAMLLGLYAPTKSINANFNMNMGQGHTMTRDQIMEEINTKWAIKSNKS